MRAPLVLVAALASAASLITAVPASAAPPPPVQDVTVTTGLDSLGTTIVTISWSPTGPETTGVRTCAQQGVHPAMDPSACDIHSDSATSSNILYLAGGKTYSFSVFAYSGGGKSAEFSAPVTTQPWHGSKVRFRVACGMPTYGEPCRFDAILTDTRIDTNLQGAKVELWRGPPHRDPTWHRYDADRTDGDGDAHVPVTLREAHYFQWRFQGVQGVLASTSYQQLLEPAIKVTAHLTRSSAGLGEKVKLYGIVRPAIDDLRITLDEHKTSPCPGWYLPGQRTRATRQQLPNGKTTFGYVMTISRSTPGSYPFRVTTGGHDGFRPGYSNTVTLTVGSGAARGSSRSAPGVPAC